MRSHLQGLLPRCREQHRVTSPLEVRPDQIADLSLVVDDEDARLSHVLLSVLAFGGAHAGPTGPDASDLRPEWSAQRGRPAASRP